MTRELVLVLSWEDIEYQPRECGSIVECLPSMCETLGPIPSTAITQTKPNKLKPSLSKEPLNCFAIIKIQHSTMVVGTKGR